MVDYIIGIDPSITGTSITVMSPDMKFIKTKFFTEIKKYADLSYNYFQSFVVPKDWRSQGDECFYNLLTNAIIGSIEEYTYYNRYILCIEGYSFSSTGKVFSIAEFIGLLKHKFHVSRGWCFVVQPPSTIKKFILKGNSNKTDLFNEFMSKYINKNTIYSINRDWVKEFESFIYNDSFKFNLRDIKSPLSDIMDSIYIAMYKVNEYAKPL